MEEHRTTPNFRGEMPGVLQTLPSDTLVPHVLDGITKSTIAEEHLAILVEKNIIGLDIQVYVSFVM
jgi:hypothetical protein